MGRKKLYSTEDLLEIVLEFNKETKHKIQFTELRDYARNYDVRYKYIEDRHFSRNPIISERVKELNDRKLSKHSKKKNAILYSGSPDTFFGLPTSEQRNTIVETRNTFYSMELKIRKLESENIILKKENKDLNNLNKTLDAINEELIEFEKEFRIFKMYIVKTVDDVTEERLLAESPEYKNNKIILPEGENFLIAKKEELFNLDKEIKKLRFLYRPLDSDNYIDDDKDKSEKPIEKEAREKTQGDEEGIDFANIFTIE